MSGFLASLKQKKWGLPLWVWALLATAILIGLYMIWSRSHNASGTANATPADAGASTDEGLVDTGTGGGGGGLGIPTSPNTSADSTTGTEPLQTDPTNIDLPVHVDPNTTTTPGNDTSPTKTTSPAKTSVVASSVVASNVLVPSNATATSLQAGVAKTGPSAVVVPGTPTRAAQLQHPAAVKVTANKTGASANKAQGVFAIH